MKDIGGKPCQNIYGSVPAVDVGATFKNRRELYCIHSSRCPIAIGPEGPHSILLQSNHNLNDRGLFFGYSTGETQKYVDDKNVAPTGQFNKNLVISFKTQLPIRIVRSSVLKNCFSPQTGFRYDGLYTVKSYELEKLKNKLVFKFELIRIENQRIVPWENVTNYISGNNDAVEITGELSPMKDYYNKNNALNFQVSIDAFCLNEKEYSQIEASENENFKKEAVKDDETYRNSSKDRKPLVLSSDRVFTVKSDVDDSVLANVLQANGVISKEVQLPQINLRVSKINDRSFQPEIYCCTDEFSDSDCNKLDSNVKIKFEDIQHEMKDKHHDMYHEQIDFKTEETAAFYKNNSEEVQDEDDNCENVSEIIIEKSPLSSKVGFAPIRLVLDKLYSSPFVCQEDMDNFCEQDATEPVEIISAENKIEHKENDSITQIIVKRRDSCRDSIIRINSKDSDPSTESQNEYIYQYVKTDDTESTENTGNCISYIRTEEINGTNLVVNSSQYYDVFRDRPSSVVAHTSISEEKRFQRDNIKNVLPHQSNNEIGTFNYSRNDFINSSVNAPSIHHDSETEAVSLWENSNNNVETKINPSSPQSLEYDFKLNPDNFKTLGVTQSSGSYCKKCAPPHELIEPLLGNLFSLFSLFYSDFFCKCKSSTSSKTNVMKNEYFNRITDLVMKLQSRNVQYLSGILAFLLHGCQTDISDVQPPVSSNPTDHKKDFFLKDNNNIEYSLIDSNGKFSLICQKDFLSSRRLENDQIIPGLELNCLNNSSNVDSLKNMLKSLLKKHSKRISKPARKRRLFDNKSRQTKRKKNIPDPTSLNVINECNIQDPFHGFNMHDVLVSGVQADLSLTALSSSLHYPPCTFPGFANTDSIKARQYFKNFTTLIESKDPVSDCNT